jgi:hypothetical protein
MKWNANPSKLLLHPLPCHSPACVRHLLPRHGRHGRARHTHKPPDLESCATPLCRRWANRIAATRNAFNKFSSGQFGCFYYLSTYTVVELAEEHSFASALPLMWSFVHQHEHEVNAPDFIETSFMCLIYF